MKRAKTQELLQIPYKSNMCNSIKCCRQQFLKIRHLAINLILHHIMAYLLLLFACDPLNSLLWADGQKGQKKKCLQYFRGRRSKKTFISLSLETKTNTVWIHFLIQRDDVPVHKAKTRIKTLGGCYGGVHIFLAQRVTRTICWPWSVQVCESPEGNFEQ